MLRFLFLLIAGFIALSVFKPEVADELVRRGRNAFVAVQQNVEPQAEQPEKQGPGSSVRIRADYSGHHVTDVEFNGRRFRALVDTGATLVALRYEDARALGVIIPGDRYDARVNTANGTARAKRVRLRSVRIGPITVSNVDAMVLEEGALAQNLLGMSFLRRLSRFEFRRGVLELED